MLCLDVFWSIARNVSSSSYRLWHGETPVQVFPAAGGSKDGMMDASIGHTTLKNFVRRILLVDTDPTGQRNRSRFHDKLYHYAHLSTDPQRNSPFGGLSASERLPIFFMQTALRQNTLT